MVSKPIWPLMNWDKKKSRRPAELRKTNYGEVVDFVPLRAISFPDSNMKEQEGKRPADIAQKRPRPCSAWQKHHAQNRHAMCWPTGYVTCDFYYSIRQLLHCCNRMVPSPQYPAVNRLPPVFAIVADPALCTALGTGDRRFCWQRVPTPVCIPICGGLVAFYFEKEFGFFQQQGQQTEQRTKLIFSLLSLHIYQT